LAKNHITAVAPKVLISTSDSIGWQKVHVSLRIDDHGRIRIQIVLILVAQNELANRNLVILGATFVISLYKRLT